MDHLLATHNVVRWLVLLFGLYAITKSARGLLKQQEYTRQHNISRILFLSVVHFQALLGIVLYFTKGWVNQLGSLEMGNSAMRFWAVEHIFGMVIAVVLIQMGSTKAKKATETKMKHRISFRYFLVAMIIILATIPWPFRELIGRPLMP